MTELRKRMIQDMTLHGYSEKTQKCYAAAVASLAMHYNRSPDVLGDEELRQFFLYMIDEKKSARSTITMHLCGIKFFYEITLGKTWNVLDIIRPRKRSKLPVILSLDEVRMLLTSIRNPTAKACLTVIYCCGLRLSEGINLKPSDIDSKRMLVHIQNGKNGKDRYVPLPERTLSMLREYWLQRKPQSWLFPQTDDTRPFNPSALQKIFAAAVRQSSLTKHASIHTLRHSYATLLLENGVDLRIIQQVLGHKSPNTTVIYTHVTNKILNTLNSTINLIMSRF